MNIWKRNAVVATVVLFVCVALYLSWSYSRTEDPLAEPTGETVFTDLSSDLSDKSGAVTDTVLSLVSPSGEAAVVNTTQVSYFTEQRLSRQKARDSALTILKDLASQDTLSDQERKDTNSEISNLATQALTEATVESLVISKGFADCVVYISDGGINVIVAAVTDGLTATDVVKIQDIVVGETDFATEAIRVVEASVA